MVSQRSQRMLYTCWYKAGLYKLRYFRIYLSQSSAFIQVGTRECWDENVLRLQLRGNCRKAVEDEWREDSDGRLSFTER